MKAWQDLETNPHISLYRTRMSLWYIDMGIKIEKFDDRIEIKNTMTSTENFEDISDEDRKIFEEKGWMAGCLHVNINALQQKIDWYQHLLNSNCIIGPETMQKKIEKNREKLLYYQQRLVKFVTPYDL
jgi:hypothetical protein